MISKVISFLIQLEWLSGDYSQIVTWKTDTSGDYIILQAELQSPLAFSEERDHASDATQYYCMKNVRNLFFFCFWDTVF